VQIKPRRPNLHWLKEGIDAPTATKIIKYIKEVTKIIYNFGF